MIDARARLARISAAAATISRATAERQEALLGLVDAVGGDLDAAAVELTGPLRLTRRGAERLIGDAEAFRYLPRVLALEKAAAVDPYRAWLIAAEMSAVLQPGDPRWAAVEAAACRKAPGLNSVQLRKELQRLLIAVDPGAARARHQAAKRGRSVLAVPDTDGMITILARLAAADGALIMLTLTAMADAAAARGDVRTRDQLRADALSELFRALIEGRPLPLIPLPAGPAGAPEPPDDAVQVPEHLVAPVPPTDLEQARELTWGQRRAWREDGERPYVKPPGPTDRPDRDLVRACPDPGPMPTPLPPPPPEITLRCMPDVFTPPVLPTRQGARIRLNLYTDLGTVTGHNDLPGWLSGYGAITADAARDLARQCGVLDLVVRDRPHPPGHLPTAGVYRPPQDLRRRTAARFPTCRGPGCGQPSDRCDQDHVQAFDRGGATCDCNLISLCRHCHVQKTAGTITPRLDEDGSVTWLTAGGQTVVVPPPDDPGHVEDFGPDPIGPAEPGQEREAVPSTAAGGAP